MKRLAFLDHGRIGYLRIHLSKEDLIDLAYIASAAMACVMAVRSTIRAFR